MLPRDSCDKDLLHGWHLLNKDIESGELRPPNISAITAQCDQDLILAIKKKELASPCSMCSYFYYKMKKVY